MKQTSRNPEIRVAIDSGGTFTDCVWLEHGRVQMLKVFSTPSDPSQPIVEALTRIGLHGSLTLLHGTTVGTNTLLQRQGARVALVTTAGFEDAVEIGRQARPKLYDFFFDRAEPLVAPELRFGLQERTASDGRILEEPSAEELRSLADALRKTDPEAIAICLLFSFSNPKNEQSVVEELETLKLPISASHQILPEFREFERASTVVINAYLQPGMQRYLENLERRVRNWMGDSERKRRSARFFVMQSSGGITALDAAAREPVRTVLSGPAGGVVGALAMARRSGFERIISFDMGGTSTDVALIDGEIRTGAQAEITGLPIGVPMLDIHTVGAGGGSIARFDAAGALRVGPESAGADPGPICYGRGTQPTVTDANLLLGRLQPGRFLGGDFVLDLKCTRKITAEWLKTNGSTLSLEQFAAGVIKVVNATMEKAVRVVSIEQGYDIREFSLVAFGGAGGLHACELAKSLGIPRVIVPAWPGALSALGILTSDVVKDYSRSILLQVDDKVPSAKIDREFQMLRRRAQENFRRESWRSTIAWQHSVDVRYRGQGYELNLPYTRNVLAAFKQEHERRYGHSYEHRAVELVTLRLRGTMKFPTAAIYKAASGSEIGRGSQEDGLKPIQVLFDGKARRAALFRRDDLARGRRHRGPAVITEYSATTVVPPGMAFWRDRGNALIIKVSG